MRVIQSLVVGGGDHCGVRAIQRYDGARQMPSIDVAQNTSDDFFAQ
jgi:hypothetical protein